MTFQDDRLAVSLHDDWIALYTLAGRISGRMADILLSMTKADRDLILISRTRVEGSATGKTTIGNQNKKPGIDIWTKSYEQI
jgi:hypothetical protein